MIPYEEALGVDGKQKPLKRKKLLAEPGSGRGGYVPRLGGLLMQSWKQTQRKLHWLLKLEQ